MKLQVSNSLTGNTVGPGIFINRLLSILTTKYDIQLVNKKAEVYLTGIQYEKDPPCKKVIFRVDGCYYDKSVHLYHHRNKAIKKGIKHSNGVIYQSQFSKKLTESILGIANSNHDFIYNGFDQSLISGITPVEKTCKWMFVSSAKWRLSKRPQSIINGFLHANIPDSKLILLGDGVSNLPNIEYTGFIPQAEVFRYYKAADAMIHMCFLDSCSNAVVEGLSFGLPIICNNIGGTPEIVGSDGIIINCDNYDFRMIDGLQDNISSELIASSLSSFVSKPFRVNRPDLDINITADKYFNFIRRIVYG